MVHIHKRKMGDEFAYRIYSPDLTPGSLTDGVEYLTYTSIDGVLTHGLHGRLGPETAKRLRETLETEDEFIFDPLIEFKFE